MAIEIVFTAHARMKFDVLRRHGVELTPVQVRETILSPGLVVRDDLGNPRLRNARWMTRMFCASCIVSKGKGEL